MPRVLLTGNESEQDDDSEEYNFDQAFDVKEFPKGKNEEATDLTAKTKDGLPEQPVETQPVKRSVGRPKGSTKLKKLAEAVASTQALNSDQVKSNADKNESKMQGD